MIFEFEKLQNLQGVGRKTEKKLTFNGIKTVCQLAQAEPHQLPQNLDPKLTDIAHNYLTKCANLCISGKEEGLCNLYDDENDIIVDLSYFHDYVTETKRKRGSIVDFMHADSGKKNIPFVNTYSLFTRNVIRTTLRRSSKQIVVKRVIGSQQIGTSLSSLNFLLQFINQRPECAPHFAKVYQLFKFETELYIVMEAMMGDGKDFIENFINKEDFDIETNYQSWVDAAYTQLYEKSLRCLHQRSDKPNYFQDVKLENIGYTYDAYTKEIRWAWIDMECITPDSMCGTPTYIDYFDTDLGLEDNDHVSGDLFKLGKCFLELMEPMVQDDKKKQIIQKKHDREKQIKDIIYTKKSLMPGIVYIFRNLKTIQKEFNEYRRFIYNQTMRIFSFKIRYAALNFTHENMKKRTEIQKPFEIISKNPFAFYLDPQKKSIPRPKKHVMKDT